MGKAPFSLEKCRTEKNEITVHGRLALMDLYDQKGAICARTIFDSDLVSLVEEKIWCFDGNGYARCSRSGTTLQEIILCVAPAGFVVDHINRDGLDNRYCNLRLIPAGVNNINKGKLTTNSTGYIGVFYDVVRGVFCASLNHNKKRVFFKRFKTAMDAATARDAAAIEHFGRYAVLNFPEPQYVRRPISF
jgi:hypothetical protein